MMNCIKPSTATKDAIEPRMVSTLFSRGGGKESGGTRNDGPASTLDAIASIETNGGCSIEVFQRETVTIRAMERGVSKYKTKTTNMITWNDETAALEADTSASEHGGSRRSADSHGTTALSPLDSRLFKGFQGHDLEQKGNKIVGVVLLTGGQRASGRRRRVGDCLLEFFSDVHH